MDLFVTAWQTRPVSSTSSPVVSLQKDALTPLLSRQKYGLDCERFQATSGWQIEASSDFPVDIDRQTVSFQSTPLQAYVS